MSDLDLVLSEGVAKKLATAYGTTMPGLPTTAAAWDVKYPTAQVTAASVVAELKKKLIDEALTTVGPIRTNLARDRAMVNGLAIRMVDARVPLAAKTFVLPKL